MMILLVLTGLLGYDFKTAVGTSLVMMTLISLFGAGSHIAFGGLPELSILLSCALSSVLFARLAARLAIRLEAAILRRVTGLLLLALAVTVLLFQHLVS